jgi:uncharacterized OsmC-like protein
MNREPREVEIKPELLTSALGTCTAITLRMYADRKRWPLDAVEIHLRHDKIRGDDGQVAGNRAARIDHINMLISLRGGLTAEQRRRLLEIANRCPVHRTLLGEVKIYTALAEQYGGSR